MVRVVGGGGGGGGGGICYQNDGPITGGTYKLDLTLFCEIFENLFTRTHCDYLFIVWRAKVRILLVHERKHRDSFKIKLRSRHLNQWVSSNFDIHISQSGHSVF